MAAQQTSVESAFSAARVTNVVLPEPSGGSTEWALRMPSGEERTVFTTPCDARVLGSLQSDFRR